MSLRPDAYHRLRHLIGDRGPCAFCGHRFGAAHRTVDAILERLRCGETVGDVAADYGLDPAVLTDAVKGEP